MADAPTTDDGQEIGGWVLKSADAASVIADLKEFGQVFRFPVPPGPRTDLLDAGQPCFLYVAEPGNPKVKPGIWAVGEVVGPATVAAVDDTESSATDGPNADAERLFAEVELLPLQTRITLGELNDHRVLVDSELVDRPERPNPIVLRPREVRALEEWDFALVEPTDEQAARLDEVLDEDDAGLILQVIATDRSIGVVDDGRDGLLAVVVVSDDDHATEIGRYQAFDDAVDAVAHHAADLELEEPQPAGDRPEGDPVGLLRADDDLLALHRIGDGFELWSTRGDGERIATFTSLDHALAGLAEAVEEITGDPEP